MSHPQTSRRATASLFAAVTGLGAFLLFFVEPLLGRGLLPWFGGTSALWTTCLLFFQAALLAGYVWAHGLARTAPRRQRDLQLWLLAAALALLAWRAASWPSPITLPLAMRPWPDEAPVAAVLGRLALAIGLPFVVLASTSPLLQAWLARVRPGRSPFWLYALSNAGALLGLVSYPLVVEPLASARVQGWLWSAAFGAYAVGFGGCAFLSARAPAGIGEPPAAPVGAGEAEARARLGERLLWLALAAAPSVLLLAVSSHLTQEVAAVPLLWTLPLTLYLLTLVVVFSWPGLGQRRFWALLLAVACLLALLGLARASALGVRERVLLWSAVLLIDAGAAHTELVRRRPGPARLTGFYLSVAAGGALGGAFAALVAPLAFSGYWELHLSLLAVPAVLAVAWLAAGRSPLVDPADDRLRLRWQIVAGASLLALAWWLAWDAASSRDGVVLARRGFYGVLRVVQEEAGFPDETLKLLHGRIAHGVQRQDPAGRRRPGTYFGPTSGVGLAIARQPRRLSGQPLRVGVVGLGVGTLAAWSRRGDVFRFYELDPEVARLSQGAAPTFTYLRDAAGETSVALGDGRLALEREPAQRFDVLALDAFSSDAIPTHLLTLEAFRGYERHLREQGVLAVQVTNRYVDLEPVVRGAARRLGLRALHVPSFEHGELWSSDWMLVGRDPWFERDEAIGAASLPEPRGGRDVVWTDDWSPLFAVLKR